jgi:UDP-glucose 4-epimerase
MDENMNMYNILIIGSSGFIGKNILNRLRNEDYKLYSIERNNTNTSNIQNEDNICYCDLKDIELISKFIKKNKIDIIIHLASNLIPSSNEEDFNNELNNVIIPTFKLIDYSVKYNIKFVFFSSGGTIYGKTKTKIISENHSRNPISYYGLSKLLIEDYILFKHRVNRLRYLILRPSNVYGKYQKADKNQGFIAVAINKILHNKPIEIWGDGEIIRDYINVEDVASITKKLIENNIENKVLNVSSGKGYSLNEILKILSPMFPKKFEVNYTRKRTVDADKIILDNSSLRKNIDFYLISLDQGIREYIESLGVVK